MSPLLPLGVCRLSSCMRRHTRHHEVGFRREDTLFLEPSFQKRLCLRFIAQAAFLSICIVSRRERKSWPNINISGCELRCLCLGLMNVICYRSFCLFIAGGVLSMTVAVTEKGKSVTPPLFTPHVQVKKTQPNLLMCPAPAPAIHIIPVTIIRGHDDAAYIDSAL